MRWGGFIHDLSQESLNAELSMVGGINTFTKDDETEWRRIVLNVGEEPATLISTSYHKKNIHFKLNLRTKLNNLRYNNVSELKSISLTGRHYLDFAGLDDPVTNKDEVWTLLRSLPKSFFTVLMPDGNNLYY